MTSGTRNRFPLWRGLNWPNRISLIRLGLIVPFILLMLNHQDWPPARPMALAVFLLVAVSDFVDGLLARRLGQQTRLGAVLDPLADKLLIICAVVLLAMDSAAIEGTQLPLFVVVAVVGKDLWVLIGFVVLYLVTDRFVVRPSVFGKASTFGQLVMVLAHLAAPDVNALAGGMGYALALALEWVVVGLSILAVISYTRMGLGVVVAEQKPLDEHDPLNARKEETAE